jgi:hypothetical protein
MASLLLDVFVFGTEQTHCFLHARFLQHSAAMA